MFVLTTGAATMAGMGAMGTTPSGQKLFYLGGVLILASFATTVIRRRRRSCAPVLAAFAR